MYRLLERHHESEATTETSVLALHPFTLQRKVKRHLYMAILRRTELFKGIRHQFLDLVLVSWELGRADLACSC